MADSGTIIVIGFTVLAVIFGLAFAALGFFATFFPNRLHEWQDRHLPGFGRGISLQDEGPRHRLFVSWGARIWGVLVMLFGFGIVYVVILVALE